MPDLVRAFALIGIAVVNVQIFSYPLEEGFTGAASAGSLDKGAYFAVAWLFLAKFYALFSLMFGASLSYQESAAERHGRAFGREQMRRLTGLGTIGLAHAIFLFSGDILVTYALLGALLLTMRGFSPKTLIRAGIGFIALNTVILAVAGGLLSLVEMAKPGLMATELATAGEAARAAFGAGTFLDAAQHRAMNYAGVLFGVLVSQGASTFGYFCMGLAFARLGWIADPDARIWSLARRYLLPLGLLTGLPGAWLYVTSDLVVSGQLLFGMVLLFIGAPLLALGYAGLLALVARRAGAIVRFLARAGRASLSAYLLQSLLLSFLFHNWGLGLYASLPAAPVIAIGAAAGLASIVCASLWMKRFGRGPVEILFRAWTYRSA